MSQVEKVFVRSPYNYDRRKASDDTALICLDESMADQSQKDDADINVMLRKFKVTGQLRLVQRPPLNIAFANVFDFQGAHNLMIDAQKSFMAMPASVRSRFDNDPALFVDFCSKPENLGEMRKMGLAVPEEKKPLEELKPEVKPS